MTDIGANTQQTEVKQLTPDELYLKALEFRESERERNDGDTEAGVKAVQKAYEGLLIGQKERV